MNAVCREVQQALAAGGPQILKPDEAAQRHVVECAACFRFLEAISELESSLRNMPRLDAPDRVVEKLVARRLRPRAAATRHLPRLGSVAWGSAAAAGLLLAVSLSLLMRGESFRPTAPRRAAEPDIAPRPPAVAESLPRTPVGRAPVGVHGKAIPSPARKSSRDQESIYAGMDSIGAAAEEGGVGVTSAGQGAPDANPQPAAVEPVTEAVGAARGAGDLAIRVVDSKDGSPLPGATIVLGSATASVPSTTQITDADGRAEFPDLPAGSGYMVDASFPGYGKVRLADVRVGEGREVIPIGLAETIQERVEVVGQREIVDLERTETRSRFGDEYIKDLPAQGRFYQDVLTLAPGVSDSDSDKNPNIHGARSRDFKAVVGGVANQDPFSGTFLNYVNPDSIDEIEAITSGAHGSFARPLISPGAATARAFLEERSSLENLHFVGAKGYWANTYVPGDTALRLLQARLEGREGSALEGYSQASLRLHEASRQTSQPFDAPGNSALAVYLHADRRGLGRESRLLVQVGLKGTARHGGQRPVMNVGVVLDLRGNVSTEVASGMRALIGALGQAKGPGDRFSLTVAGRTGGTIVGPENFRHGHLMVAMDRLFGGGNQEGQALGIVEGVAKTIERVASADEPTSPLGSSAVLLVTGQTFGASTDELVDLVHRSAIAGIPVSVVGIGPGVQLAEIDRLSLSGQGNRRLLASAAEAAGLVDRELSAVSRAIARAVRLRIRLAPGVKLIGVLGSESLDEARAQRVRDAERSIDLRLSKNLGIEADRGEDEEGIQIFIPNFYAGGAHVVLLDVTAPGPGPIADARARYKDLVYMRNGVAQATLSLGRDQDMAGPLERNVLKNLLALRLSDALERAGRALATGERERAASLLREFRDLLMGLGVQVPELDGDPDTTNDIHMLGEYLTLLQAPALGRPESMAYLSDSLRYAARLKLLPRPVVN